MLSISHRLLDFFQAQHLMISISQFPKMAKITAYSLEESGFCSDLCYSNGRTGDRFPACRGPRGAPFGLPRNARKHGCAQVWQPLYWGDCVPAGAQPEFGRPPD